MTFRWSDCYTKTDKELKTITFEQHCVKQLLSVCSQESLRHFRGMREMSRPFQSIPKKNHLDFSQCQHLSFQTKSLLQYFLSSLSSFNVFLFQWGSAVQQEHHNMQECRRIVVCKWVNESNAGLNILYIIMLYQTTHIYRMQCILCY